MNNRKVTIKTICELNKESLNVKNTPNKIVYLDTSSITRNVISGLQLLDASIDAFPSRAKRKVRNETIIYSTVRPEQEHFGILKNPEDDLIVSTGFLTLDVIDEEVDPKYLYYSLTRKDLTNYLHTIATNNVSSYPSLNPDDIGNLELCIHSSIHIQQKIASVLSSFDAKIELNNRINVELEAMAKTLYDYWFVQFDFPDVNGKPYKSSGGVMEYNSELKLEIPKGWEVKPLANWIANIKGGDWGSDIKEGNYTQIVSCVRGADINGLNGTGELKPPTRYILEKNAHKLLEPNDLIVEISGGSPTQSTGRLSFIIEETLNRFENPIICSNFCKSFSLTNPKYLYSFVYMWNSFYDNGILFGWEGKTSGIKNLLFDSFTEKYFTVIPSEKINEKFYTVVNSLQKKKQKNLQENEQLAELRDWLLPMLMNGQIKVI